MLTQSTVVHADIRYNSAYAACMLLLLSLPAASSYMCVLQLSTPLQKKLSVPAAPAKLSATSQGAAGAKTSSGQLKAPTATGSNATSQTQASKAPAAIGKSLHDLCMMSSAMVYCCLC